MTRDFTHAFQSTLTLFGPLAAILAALWASPSCADTLPPAAPFKDAAGLAPLDARMRTLVQTRCAACHTGRDLGTTPDNFGAAFDLSKVALDELASDPGLVKPGFAEASPLFQVLLGRHRPRLIGSGGVAGAELLLVRDWIEGLPSPSACAEAASDDELADVQNAGLVISLRHLAGPCRPAGRIAEWRSLVDELLGALTRGRFSARSVDANGLVIAVHALEFDRLTGADLEALRGLNRGGAVALDALAAFVLDRGLAVRDEVRPAVAALARMSRQRAPSGRGLDVVLRSDAGKARIGDLVSLKVSVTAPCHLTIVSIDTGGRALVMFPNEIEDDALMQPGVERTVPGAKAGYQVRFDKPGTETFLAFCQSQRVSLDGIKVDYEKQRFPVLGDWRGFLAVMDARQADLEKAKRSDETRRSRRRGRDREGEAKPAPPLADATSQAEDWAALRIVVE